MFAQTSICLIGLFFAPHQGLPDGNVVRDQWETLEFQGKKIGSRHVEFHSFSKEDTNLPSGARKIRETLSLEMTRFGQTIRLKQIREDLEDANGLLIGSAMEQSQNNKITLQLQVNPEGQSWTLLNKSSGTRKSQTPPFPPLGIGKIEERWIAGDSGPWCIYEPMVHSFIKVQARTTLEKNKLEITSKGPQGETLPMGAMMLTFANRGEIHDREFDMPGLGRITSRPADQAVAQKPGVATLDIGSLGLIPLNRTLPKVPPPTRVVYRLHAPGELDLSTLISSEDRQEIRTLQEGFVELTAFAGKAPTRRISTPPPKEYMLPSRMIDHNDSVIRGMAQASGAFNDDSWTAAKRLERYVKSTLVPDASAPIGTASEAARSKRGDCRHAAILLCALCRAAALPARTVTGLVYIERAKSGSARSPYLGFHMWAEVYIDGQWVGLDGTLGKGGISPGHIKVGDQSWYQEESLAPLIPVQKLIGKVQAEILRVD